MSSLRRRGFLTAVGITAASLSGCAATESDLDSVQGTAGEMVGFGYGGPALVSRVDTSGAETVFGALSTAESEPNDDRADAVLIATDTTVSGTLSTADIDWYAFETEADTDLTIEFQKLNADGIVAVVLYRPTGDFVDQVYVNTTKPVSLTETTAEAGTHYVQVVDIENGSAEYTVTVGTGDQSLSTSTPDPTPTPTPTVTETPTSTVTTTETATPTQDEYGEQTYGEAGYGGVYN